jgi:hypothetical protein
MMRLFAALFMLSLLSLPGCASDRRGPPSLKLTANPSALVAQEIAFARTAQEKGQWTAFREFAGPGSVMFVPEPVKAPEWLKSRPDPAAAVKWQTHAVFMSCDGKTGVTRGAWQSPDGKHGLFTTVWQRYDKNNGDGKWLFAFDDGVPHEQPVSAPDFISSQTASCKGRAPAALTAPAEGTLMKQSLSFDQSLSWTFQYRPDKSRDIKVALWDGSKMAEVIAYSVAAPAP